MMIKVVFLALLGGTTAYEMPRTNRIRFPSNEPPPQNYFGPQIFAAESQDAPSIRTVPHFNGHMFNIVPQVPSHSKPFGEENKKGFSQGLIYNGGPQDEFYHPVPPPQYEMYPTKNKFPQNFNGQKRHPERHRFSPQRPNMHGKPFGHHAPQKLFNPAMEKPENFNHEFMEVFPSFKRPMQNFNDGRFHEQRPLKDEDIENFKKPVHSRPHIMINPKPIYKQQFEQDYPEDSMDYQEYEKRRPNVEVTQEKLRVQNNKEHFMEQNFRTSEPNYFMPENFRTSEPNYKTTEYEDYSQKSDQKVSGEWIPINAPEGALPAKSYEIPAPDLSVRYQDDYDERPQKQRVRVQKRPSNVVYGGRKKVGNEEVVSASVMVKQ